MVLILYYEYAYALHFLNNFALSCQDEVPILKLETKMGLDYARIAKNTPRVKYPKQSNHVC